MTTTAPVSAGERIAFWDVLRGIAVLGILFANIPYMALAGATVENDLEGAGTLDLFAFAFVFVLADTKFISIFSTLFGAGLAWMYLRASERGDRFVPRYLRRLLVLAGIGVVHATCIWFGDILVPYALIGLVAILFRKARPRTLLIWAAILFIVNSLAWSMFAFLDPADLIEPAVDVSGQPLSPTETLELRQGQYREVFASGDFGAMAEQRTELWLETLPFLVIIFGLRTLALFLTGMAAVKAGWFTDPAARRATFRRLAAVGLCIGVPLQGLALVFELQFRASGDAVGVQRAIGMTALYFGGFCLAWAYISLTALWCTGRWGAAGLRGRLAAVGRMALTNYLAHSVITGLVFSYAGFYDQWSRPVLLLLVLAIFALQLWLSPIWLRHFRFGPAEWLWRSLTYGRVQPMLSGSQST